MTCAEIQAERGRIEQEVAESSDALRTARKQDQAKLILLPASLLIKDGDKEKDGAKEKEEVKPKNTDDKEDIADINMEVDENDLKVNSMSKKAKKSY